MVAAVQTKAGKRGQKLMVDEKLFQPLNRWANERNYEEVRADVLCLVFLVKDALAKGSPIRKHFEKLIADADDAVDRNLAGVPSMQELLYAKAAFYSLPRKEQQRMLNGWCPAMEGMTADEITKCELGKMPSRYLSLSRRHDGNLDAWQYDRFDEGRAEPVMLYVRAGASQEEVISSLSAMHMAVAVRWPELINLKPNSGETVSINLVSLSTRE